MEAIDPIIYDKLVRYCAYQERAISELRKKMGTLGVVEERFDDYIQVLQEEGIQNEERYALAFTEGKSRIKGWGMLKVKAHLKAKQVSSDIITRVTTLDVEDEYLERLRELAESKLERVKGKNDYERKSKVFRFLQQRGYASSHIHKILFGPEASNLSKANTFEL